MQNIRRPAPFVLISSNHGTMIINRNDYLTSHSRRACGVGFQLMNSSSCDQAEVDCALTLLMSRKANYGSGVVAIDCGANIGVHTIEWARTMSSWGSVYSFEPQEKLYYALAGNIAINNCFNVTARLAAVGAECGSIKVPKPNYFVPSSYGSLELIKSTYNEYIGQEIDYEHSTMEVDMISIDSLSLPRLDFVKIDVEGMEQQVLEGSSESISKFKPQLLVEIIKSNKEQIMQMVKQNGYTIFAMGRNILGIHDSDPMLAEWKGTIKADG